MFKDAKEELQRLEAELLKEAAAEEDEQDAPLDEPNDELPNHSKLHRSVRAYNTDVSDDDLETYSREVYQIRKRSVLMTRFAFAMALVAITLCALAYWAIRLWG